MPKKGDKRAANRVSQYTIRQIHEAILNSHGVINRAATNLHRAIRGGNLGLYLGKFKLYNPYMNFRSLFKLSVAEAQEIFKEKYDQVAGLPSAGGYKYTIEQMHAVILKPEHVSAARAGQELGLSASSLKKHLATIIIDDEELTFKRLKTLTPDALQDLIGEELYTQHRKHKLRTSILEYALKDIYETVSTSKNIHVAAFRLRINIKALKNHLQMFSVHNKSMTFESLKSLSELEVQQQFKPLYNIQLPIEPCTTVQLTLSNMLEERADIPLQSAQKLADDQLQTVCNMIQNNELQEVAIAEIKSLDDQHLRSNVLKRKAQLPVLEKPVMQNSEQYQYQNESEEIIKKRKFSDESESANQNIA